MKKLISLILICALTLCLPLAASADYDFNDWDPEAWFAAAMAYCVDTGIFQGTAANNIEGRRAITRAEFLTALVRYFGYTEAGDASFDDVSENEWFYEYVTIGATAGITYGVGNGKFNPYNTITRQEAITMFVRALRLDTDGTDTDEVLASIPDGENISDWARDAVATAVSYGIIQGDNNGDVLPANDLTRGEAAEMFYKTRSTEIGDEETPLADLPVELAPVPAEDSDGGDAAIVSYVWFYPMNGANAFAAELTGAHISAPSDPSRSGYHFGGWYTQSAGGYKYDFAYDAAYSDMVLYARWYSDAEWAAMQELNGLAGAGEVSFSAETDLLATIGEPVLPCVIRYGGGNQQAATVRLVRLDGDGTEETLVSFSLSPGDELTEITLDRAMTSADYGNYDARFIVTPDNGSPVVFEARLYVAYLWYAG